MLVIDWILQTHLFPNMTMLFSMHLHNGKVLYNNLLRMKKYTILLLILSMCGGTADTDLDSFEKFLFV